MTASPAITTCPSPAGEITLVTLTNASGASVTLSSLGAGVISVIVPDRRGRMADVALGYADPADYMADPPSMGKTPGRYANRIALGRFSIDGRTYSLPVNNGRNSLHGGPDGFQNRIWRVVATAADSVTFALTSPDGDSGYPGALEATVSYRWTDDRRMCVALSATTSAPTVVNLTNHTYWNLAGHDSGTVLTQTLRLNASRYLPTDPGLIPTGSLDSVLSTPMDFTSAKPLGRDIRQPFPALDFAAGYDNSFAIDDHRPGLMLTAAVLADPTSGRRLEVVTDQPAVHIYTANHIAGGHISKSGRRYDNYEGVAIECQDFPDAPNHSSFPSTLLEPGQTYLRHIEFVFSTAD